MSYSDIKDPRVSIFKKIRYKLLLGLLSFPLNKVRLYALKSCSFEVGKKVYIGSGVVVASILGDNRCKLYIGDRVAFGSRGILLLSSDACWSKLNNVIKPIRGEIRIEEDCWIGVNVIILPNVTIGKCSIVGAGSVVTKDIPPYSVVAGIPAKVIRTLNKEDIG